MIDVIRSQPAPASLASGTWRTPEVLRRLYDDFLRKCYLCETPFRGPGEPEVDHRHQRGSSCLALKNPARVEQPCYEILRKMRR